MLQFNNQWRYYPPGTIDKKIINDIFNNVISPIKTNIEKQEIYEIFKRHFAGQTGGPTGRSSDESWAQSDLYTAMYRCGEKNVALFAEALYDGLMEIESGGKTSAIPPWEYINASLAPSGFAISPPYLIASDNYVPIEVPDVNPSLDEQAKERIQSSLRHSEAHLRTGSYRAAVHETLWLLETITTAFRGVQASEGSIQGKYFSKIIVDLRRLHQGKTLDQVMSWLDKMYGYLSAPDGGGIRHGSTLDRHVELTQNEARLFCDLTRSYITYLLSEHSRLVVESGREKRY